jgi:hypothetical protein
MISAVWIRGMLLLELVACFGMASCSVSEHCDPGAGAVIVTVPMGVSSIASFAATGDCESWWPQKCAEIGPCDAGDCPCQLGALVTLSTAFRTVDHNCHVRVDFKTGQTFTKDLSFDYPAGGCFTVVPSMVNITVDLGDVSPADGSAH